MAASPDGNENRSGHCEAGREQNQSDALDMAAAKHQRQQDAHCRQHDRQHKQEPTSRRRVGQDGCLRHQEGSPSSLDLCGSSAPSVASACLLEEPQQQGDGHGRRRERNDNAGDDQRLRHRIGAEPGCRTPPGDDPEQQEHTASENVEGQDLAQRLRVGDEAEQSKSHQRGAANPEQRRRVHRCCIRSGGPAASRPSVTPIDSVKAASATMISGLA